MKEVTLKDLADRLGISITTVSKALKNYSDVSPKTKAAVIELANKLNFTPNHFALYLKSNQSKTIGLIIPEIVHNFFSNVTKGIIKTAEQHGNLVIVLQSYDLVSLEKKQVDMLINKRVDGIIISLSNESNADQHLKAIVQKKIPMVQFDKIAKMIPSSKVVINDQKAAFEAVEHLIKKGCKKIIHIRGPINPQNSIDRFLGYKNALEHYHIPYDPNMVFTCNKVDFNEGFQFAKQIYESKLEVDGIFAITDLVALGILNFYRQTNIKIPEEIKVIGFSNSLIANMSNPKLSTIDQPAYEMGVTACSLLLEEIKAKQENKSFYNKTVVLDVKILERETT